MAQLFSLGSIRVMTKQEFITKQQAWKKSTFIDLAIMLVCYFALCGGVILWKQYRVSHGGPAWVSGCGLFLAVALPIILAVLLYQRRVRRFGFDCPRCGKSLFGGKSGQAAAKIVVASGNCCFCGAKICD